MVENRWYISCAGRLQNGPADRDTVCRCDGSNPYGKPGRGHFFRRKERDGHIVLILALWGGGLANSGHLQLLSAPLALPQMLKIAAFCGCTGLPPGPIPPVPLSQRSKQPQRPRPPKCAPHGVDAYLVALVPFQPCYCASCIWPKRSFCIEPCGSYGTFAAVDGPRFGRFGAVVPRTRDQNSRGRTESRQRSEAVWGTGFGWVSLSRA